MKRNEFAVRAAFPVLEPGEELYWAGQPDVERYKWADGAGIQYWFGILGNAGLCLFLIFGGLAMWGGESYPFELIPFLLFGMAFFTGFCWLVFWGVPRRRGWRAQKMVYAVTSRRVLGIRTASATDPTASSVEELLVDHLTTREGLGDNGTLVLSTSGRDPVRLRFIDDVHEVEALVRQLPVLRAAVGMPRDAAVQAAAGMDGPGLPVPETGGPLAEGETVLWTGRPHGWNVFFRLWVWLGMVFGGFFVAMAGALGLAFVLKQQVRPWWHSPLAAVFLSFFAGMVLLVIVLCLRYMRLVRSRRYLVTNRRLLCSGLDFPHDPSVRVCDQRFLRCLTVHKKAGRVGCLAFSTRDEDEEVDGVKVLHEFTSIEDPEGVRRLILQQDYAAHLR